MSDTAKKATPAKKVSPRAGRVSPRAQEPSGAGLVETTTPDGRKYYATPEEAARLNRTAGYKIKN